MGLDTTHNCWHGAYSAFHRWRCAIANAAGFKEVHDEHGRFDAWLMNTEAEPMLAMLLSHSDCDGGIASADCRPLADRLEQLLPALDAMGDGGGHVGWYGDKTRTFIKGLRAAAAAGEDVEFR